MCIAVVLSLKRVPSNVLSPSAVSHPRRQHRIAVELLVQRVYQFRQQTAADVAVARRVSCLDTIEDFEQKRNLPAALNWISTLCCSSAAYALSHVNTTSERRSSRVPRRRVPAAAAAIIASFSTGVTCAEAYRFSRARAIAYSNWCIPLWSTQGGHSD